MNPRQHSAGVAGILSGIALMGEFVLFMMSGFSPETFADPAAALAFIRDRGAYLRAAVLFGAAGTALTTIFVVGLAALLHPAAPTRATAALYFGVMGSVGHGLVALSFWLGVPAFVALASRDQSAAANAWGAFQAMIGGFEGFGNLLLAFSLLAAGWAIASTRALPVALGWVGVFAGAATVARVLTTDTPLAALGMAAFFPSLLLAVVFRLWAGATLRKAGRVNP